MGRAFEFRKNRKLKRWDKISKLFTKLTKDIIMSVKYHGADVNSNYNLKFLINKAKSLNMPKDNINRAINRGLDKNTKNNNYKNLTLHGYGPYGVAIIVDCCTNNHNRTVANIRSYFNKNCGQLSVTGSVDFIFSHVCIFNITINPEIDIDNYKLFLIDIGINNFEDLTSKYNILIYSDFENYGKIVKILDKDINCTINYYQFDRIPKIKKYLNEEQAKYLNNFIEILYKDEDVNDVYSNIM